MVNFAFAITLQTFRTDILKQKGNLGSAM